MKKVFKIFLLFLMVIVMSGCNKEKTVNNNLSSEFKVVTSNGDVVYNLNKSVNEVNGFNFKAVATIKDKDYEVSGKVILGETIEKSTLHISYKNNNIYVKKGNVYISYYYNNTNVIVKDTLDNFINETFKVLDKKQVKYNKDKVVDIIKNKTLKDIDFNLLTKYISYSDLNEAQINYKGGSVILNNDYLPVSASYENNKMKIKLTIDYGSVSVKIPLGYNLFTLDIEGIKDLLKVDNISDLIK